jgi:hypothetical protein
MLSSLPPKSTSLANPYGHRRLTRAQQSTSTTATSGRLKERAAVRAGDCLLDGVKNQPPAHVHSLNAIARTPTPARARAHTHTHMRARTNERTHTVSQTSTGMQGAPVIMCYQPCVHARALHEAAGAVRPSAAGRWLEDATAGAGEGRGRLSGSASMTPARSRWTSANHP